MSDISIRKTGRAGRITLTRPKALNALTYEMMMAIDAILGDWAEDPEVALVVIDAEGDRAFCSGGDIAEMDLLAQALHEAEETRDQAILYLEQREAELMEQAAQTEAELRATSDSLKDARREVDDLTSYIARIKAKT